MSYLYALQRHHSSQKAMSSSSHEYASKSAQGSGNYGVTEEMLSTWNKVLGLPIFHNKPLLPFEEWNIDFSELTVGTRVGIGKNHNTIIHKKKVGRPKALHYALNCYFQS